LLYYIFHITKCIPKYSKANNLTNISVEVPGVWLSKQIYRNFYSINLAMGVIIFCMVKCVKLYWFKIVGNMLIGKYILVTKISVLMVITNGHKILLFLLVFHT
jgi:hypothetical protein